MKRRDLSTEEKAFLVGYTYCDDDIKKSMQAIDLVREASIESLCEVVINQSFDICPIISRHLNDNADALGYNASCAVEKMARVKGSPWAINQLQLTKEELAFVDSVQSKFYEKRLLEGLRELNGFQP